jgi:hypothetical protein
MFAIQSYEWMTWPAVCMLSGTIETWSHQIRRRFLYRTAEAVLAIN